MTEKVNIANGTINYTQSDLNLMAIKLQNSSGGYDNANSVPTSGYTLSSTSYCEVDGVKDTSITMEYKDGKVIIPVSTKNTKCYLYFDEIKGTSISDILAGLTKESRTNFNMALTTNTTGKIYIGQDNDGTSYYYAGAVDNNWVKFGGFYWRIVRINGDGTLRMIYNGTTNAQTGTGTQIGTSAFNGASNIYDNNSDVGYMYDASNTNSSDIKQVVDKWYETNIKGKDFEKYISTAAGFCGDRQSGQMASTGQFAVAERLENGDPSLKCENTNDLYTVSSSNKGNKDLTYPIGLISADEVAYAGGTGTNTSYYLYTNQNYWTMSPSTFQEDYAYVFYVNSYGNNSEKRIKTVYGVRPVINLKADTLFFKGDGSKTSPFEI